MMKMLEPFQILMIVVGVFGIVRAIFLFRQRRITFGWLIFWGVIFAGLAVTSFVPAVSYYVSKPLGIERGMDLVIYLAILLLFYLVFKLLLKIEKLEQNITELVRAISLKKK